jgi:ferredoxin
MSVAARTRQRDLVLHGQGTLLSSCLAKGLPVASACSGRGACGKCVLTVLQGAEALCDPSAHEEAVLARNGAANGQRLGCQCWLSAVDEDLIITTGYW